MLTNDIVSFEQLDSGILARLLLHFAYGCKDLLLACQYDSTSRAIWVTMALMFGVGISVGVGIGVG